MHESNVLICSEHHPTLLDSCQFPKLISKQEQDVIDASLTLPLLFNSNADLSVIECRPKSATTLCYNPVAAFLVEEHPEELLQFEVLKISVTDQGYTVVDDKSGTSMYVATSWPPDEGGPVQLGNINGHMD